jgi:hypothetical protein
MKSELKIEAGKHYRLRNVQRMRCYAVDGFNGNVHGAALFKDGWFQKTWSIDGTGRGILGVDLDIISEWVDN